MEKKSLEFYFSFPGFGVLCVNFHIPSACRYISDYKKGKAGYWGYLGEDDWIYDTTVFC